MTFAKACSHIDNYHSVHEPPYARWKLVFPDNHIVVSPHLTWVLGPLVEKNPGAIFIHLRRGRREVVNSWMNRGRRLGPGLWTPLSRIPQQTDAAWKEACEMCHDSIVAQIQRVPRKVWEVWLHEAQDWWPEFWRRIGAQGNYEKALAEWGRKHNASR